MSWRMMAVAGALALLAACSSIKSTRRVDPGSAVGLVYYMPMKALAVSVTEYKVGQSEEIKATVVVDESAAYADLSESYLLTMPRNEIALNKIDVKVSAAGLLTTSSSVESDGQVNEIVASLAQSIAAVGDGLGDSGGPAATGPTPNCTLGVAFTAVVVPGSDEHRTLCGTYQVTLEALAVADQVDDQNAVGIDARDEVRSGNVDGTREGEQSPAPEGPENGFYYRQNRPYVLTVTRGSELVHRSVRFLPNESAVHFLPLRKTFIGKNQATVTFADGVPTQYKQDTEGEVIGAARIPFEVVGAFFGAVGSIFTARKTAATSQDGYLQAVASLATRQQQTELCLAAVRRGIQADIVAACP